jgi:hypothetical protein
MKAVFKTLVLLVSLQLAAGCAVEREREIEDISRQIRSILELPTFEHVYRDVVYIDRERSFLIFKTMDAEVLFAVNVRIQAGIDLRDGFAVHRTRKDGLTVALPPAKILLADADEESIEQYFLKEIGGGISRLDYYDEINLKKEALIRDAVERGILERAGENARLLIGGFLENVHGEPVTFVTAGGGNL